MTTVQMTSTPGIIPKPSSTPFLPPIMREFSSRSMNPCLGLFSSSAIWPISRGDRAKVSVPYSFLLKNSSIRVLMTLPTTAPRFPQRTAFPRLIPVTAESPAM